MSNPKCKVCSLPDDIRQAVNDMAMGGNSFDSISKWVKTTHSINISSASILRHANTHLEGFTPRSVLEPIQNSSNVSQATGKPDETRISINSGDILDQLGIGAEESPIISLSRIYAEIVKNQAIIALGKQQQHLAGNCSFPKDELTLFLSMLDKAGLRVDLTLPELVFRGDQEGDSDSEQGTAA